MSSRPNRFQNTLLQWIASELKFLLHLCLHICVALKGSQDVASEKELLKSNGITHIINAATGIRNYFPEEFRYLKLSLLDIPEQDIRKDFEMALAFIDEATASGGSAFVHCNAG